MVASASEIAAFRTPEHRQAAFVWLCTGKPIRLAGFEMRAKWNVAEIALEIREMVIKYRGTPLGSLLVT